MIRRRERRENDPPTRFVPGELVRHRRYGYRGVVVDVDLECRASEDWYQSNQSQPDRDQPWYHVLVHGSPQATYAAESNLIADYEKSEILHPLIDEFFDGFEEGGYRRNDREWKL